ncbi:hypothetical protein XarbCFBP8150_00540 [Xanthomonas arboricola]|uniref:hypothetical protein n=1 Tax=Xanthomonas arboricola TaxID=56448 RepID=UPI000CEDCA56|nr:hypothetical protein [Xanthomonas arboricola]PPT72982.1 hypothetical protein XarbCFBP8150_00540 [Xanthomonas arboricola]
MSKVDWFTQDLADEADKCGEDDDKRQRLLSAVAATTTWITHNQLLGSTELVKNFNIPGLRYKKVISDGEFDYLAFYVIESTGIARMSRLVWSDSDFASKIRMAEGK